MVSNKMSTKHEPGRRDKMLFFAAVSSVFVLSVYVLASYYSYVHYHGRQSKTALRAVFDYFFKISANEKTTYRWSPLAFGALVVTMWCLCEHTRISVVTVVEDYIKASAWRALLINAINAFVYCLFVSTLVLIHRNTCNYQP